MKNLNYFVIGISVVVSVIVLGVAYNYKYRAQETVVVTGLGEAEFMSDLIVWRGALTAESSTVDAGYAQIESNKKKVKDYLAAKGVAPSEVVFGFVNVNKEQDGIYNQQGMYMGQRFTGYKLSQSVVIESRQVDKIEVVSREISSLIAQGVSIEAYEPSYYYSRLDSVKLYLIEKASTDAKLRAQTIAENAGAKAGKLKSVKMGVFQITGANSNEEYSAGGSFNTSSRNKKARVTVRAEYKIK